MAARPELLAPPPTLGGVRAELAATAIARSGGARPAAVGTDATPLVSIVTVVWNGARTLQATIDSVAAQDYPAIEYVVVDGGSTDGTLDILARNDGAITRWLSARDRGIYDAMNRGVALAGGRLIKLLNADDLLTPGSVRAAVDAWRAGGGAPCVVKSDLELIDDDGTPIKRMSAARAMNPFGGVVHPSWYVDRAVYEAHGLYQSSFRVSADYELFARLRTRGVPFVQVATPLACFRVGGASSGFAGLRERYLTNRAYLGTPRALGLLARQGIVKARGRLLRRAFDERTLAALQRWLRPTGGDR